MSTTDSRRLIRNGAVAAIVGATIGAAAGFWSLHWSAPAAARAAGTPAAPNAIQASSVPSADHAGGSSQPGSRAIASSKPPDNRESDSAARSTSARATSPTRTAPATTPNAGADDEHVLQRARALAQRPDVVGLIALRKDVARRAAERGLANSPSIKSELDEVDRRLNEARMLQLKLDAEALRKAESNPPR